MNKKMFDLFINDKTGATIVVIPNDTCKTAFDAQKIANRHFKGKTANLTVKAGIRKGNKAVMLDSLGQVPNCWMVWR